MKFSASGFFRQSVSPHGLVYPIIALSNFNNNSPIYSKVKDNYSLVSTTLARNEKSSETESFSIFCLDAIELQYLSILSF
jgi:hypothetical protein